MSDNNLRFAKDLEVTKDEMKAYIEVRVENVSQGTVKRVKKYFDLMYEAVMEDMTKDSKKQKVKEDSQAIGDKEKV